MAWVRNIVYLTLLGLLTPILAWKAWRTGKYREGWRQKLLGHVPRRDSDRRCAWFHAVSMGEIRVLHRLVPQFARQHPEWEIVVSTTTLTGKQVALEQFSDYNVFYCPLDFSWAVSNALRRIRPDLIVLAELEIWPNFIQCAKRAKVPVCVINGRLSERSFRGYRRVNGLLRSTFRALSYIGVQSETYRDRFVALGADPLNVEVTGSLKFDGVTTDRQAPEIRAMASLVQIESTDQVWLAGSTQPEEDDLVLDVFTQLAARYPRLRLILVPRHPERFRDAGRKIAAVGLPWLKRSELARLADGDAAKAEGVWADGVSNDGHLVPPTAWRVLLVDSVGELSRWWGLADIAYVGGSLGRRGGQNMIEPAAFGAAVCFGPSTANFRDVVQLLLECDGARVIHDGPTLREFVERCLLKPEDARALGQRARDLVQAQQGATELTLRGLSQWIENDRQADSKSSLRGFRRRGHRQVA